MIGRIHRLRTIYLPTIQHTGTWTMIEALRTSRDVSGVYEWRLIRTGEQLPAEDGVRVLHVHIGNDAMVDGPGVKHDPLKGFGTTLGELELLARQLPTIIPIRDPLLALITRQKRHPNLRHDHIVEGFVRVAKLGRGPEYFPVDLAAEWPEQHRYMELSALFDRIGIAPPDRRHVVEWASQNSRGQHPLKMAYLEGDFDRVIAGLEPHSYAQLLENEHVIRPFLTRLGYGRLPWYS